MSIYQYFHQMLRRLNPLHQRGNAQVYVKAPVTPSILLGTVTNGYLETRRSQNSIFLGSVESGMTKCKPYKSTIARHSSRINHQSGRIDYLGQYFYGSPRLPIHAIDFIWVVVALKSIMLRGVSLQIYHVE